MKKILISGGHLTPALAFIDHVQTSKSDVKLIFAGRIYSQDQGQQKAHEKKEVTKRKIKFVSFNAPRFNQSNFLLKIKDLFFLIFSFFHAVFLIIRFRPNLFLSFGGYLSIPLGFAARLFRVPILIHEQTKTAGSANKILSKFAKKIAISYKKTASLFPKEKVVYTGNPIRPDLLTAKPKKPSWAKSLSNKKPILFITGGNQGSYIINTTITQILPKITSSWNVIHACGNPTNKINYKSELTKAKRKLNNTARKHYIIKEWLETDELSWIYNKAEAVVSRAGANTIQEIAFAGIPSILIPLPFSKGNEQLLNARTLTDAGAALLLEQKNLNAETLLKKLTHLKKYQRSIKRKLEPLKPQPGGALKLWEVANELL